MSRQIDRDELFKSMEEIARTSVNFDDFYSYMMNEKTKIKFEKVLGKMAYRMKIQQLSVKYNLE
jgi:hypothetical protein